MSDINTAASALTPGNAPSREEVLAALRDTPITDGESDVARRYWIGEASIDDLGVALEARLRRALAKIAPPEVCPECREAPCSYGCDSGSNIDVLLARRKHIDSSGTTEAEVCTCGTWDDRRLAHAPDCAALVLPRS